MNNNNQRRQEYTAMCAELGIKPETTSEKIYAPSVFSNDDAIACGYTHTEYIEGVGVVRYKYADSDNRGITDEKFESIKSLYVKKKLSDEENANASKADSVAYTSNVNYAPKVNETPAIFNSSSFASRFFYVMMYIFWIGGFIASIVLSFQEIPVVKGNSVDYETTFNWVTMIIILLTSAFSGFFSRCICEVIETLNEIRHNTAITAKNSGK